MKINYCLVTWGHVCSGISLMKGTYRTARINNVSPQTMQINEQGLRLADPSHIMSRQMYCIHVFISIWFNYDSLKTSTKYASNSLLNNMFVHGVSVHYLNMIFIYYKKCSYLQYSKVARSMINSCASEQCSKPLLSIIWIAFHKGCKMADININRRLTAALK